MGTWKLSNEEKLFRNEPDTRKQILNTDEYPYCCIGLISGQLGGQEYCGTGCLISGRVVLTCAHNIYDRQSEKNEINLTFVPGAKGKKGREYKVIKTYYSFEFRVEGDESSQFDYCVMELEEDLGSRYGWIGIDARKENLKKVEEVEICGYPCDKDIYTMWNARG